jgi:hypothetical protein
VRGNAGDVGLTDASQSGECGEVGDKAASGFGEQFDVALGADLVVALDEELAPRLQEQLGEKRYPETRYLCSCGMSVQADRRPHRYLSLAD